jgi:hypothetical protein
LADETVKICELGVEIAMVILESSFEFLSLPQRFHFSLKVTLRVLHSLDIFLIPARCFPQIPSGNVLADRWNDAIPPPSRTEMSQLCGIILDMHQ